MGFTKEDAEKAAKEIGIDWDKYTFTVSDLVKGMDVELEHGTRYDSTNITNDEPVPTAKIALAHLYELPDYYDRLERMEAEGKEALKEASETAMPGVMLIPRRPPTSAELLDVPMVINVDGHVYTLRR